MKLIISIIILLTLNACGKEEKYLSATEAVGYIKNGYSLMCKKGNEEILINRNVIFVGYIAGTYMFTSNNNPKYAGILPNECKLPKR